jgi:hypothetical protein
MVLISCETKTPRQRAVELVHKKDILADHPGVLLAECSRIPKLLAKEEMGSVADLGLPPSVYVNGTMKSCGISVLASGTASPVRKATIGGIVCSNGMYYGLTAFHAFSKAPEIEISSEPEIEFSFYGLGEPDDSSDDEDWAAEVTSQDSVSSKSNRSRTSDGESSVDQSLEETNTAQEMDTETTSDSRDKTTLDLESLLKFGTVVTFPNQPMLDWALVRVEHSDLMFFNPTYATDECLYVAMSKPMSYSTDLIPVSNEEQRSCSTKL